MKMSDMSLPLSEMEPVFGSFLYPTVPHLQTIAWWNYESRTGTNFVFSNYGIWHYWTPPPPKYGIFHILIVIGLKFEDKVLSPSLVRSCVCSNICPQNKEQRFRGMGWTHGCYQQCQCCLPPGPGPVFLSTLQLYHLSNVWPHIFPWKQAQCSLKGDGWHKCDFYQPNQNYD